MTRTAAKSDRVERLFRELPESYRGVAAALRSTIVTEGPSLVEVVKWNNPFWVGTSDVLCLQCYEDHVNLGFLRGAELAPAHTELEGTGKAMRHLKVKTEADARSDRVRRIIRAAIELDAR